MKKCNEIDYLSLDMMEETLDYVQVHSDATIIEKIKELPDIHKAGRDGRTLLIHAALYKRYDVAKWLIEKGADIEARDSQGYTALHSAVLSNCTKIAELLLDKGADVNARNSFGRTPLLCATHLTTEMVALLMKRGADPTLQNDYGISALQVFMAYPEIMSLLEK